MNLHHMLYLGVQNAINSSLIMNACQMSTLLHIDQRLTIISLHILWLCSPAEDIAGKRKQFTATEKKYNVVYERFVCFLTVPPSLLDRAIACKSSVDLSLSKLHSDTVYFYHLISQVEQAFISLMCVSCFSAVSVVTVKC